MLFLPGTAPRFSADLTFPKGPTSDGLLVVIRCAPLRLRTRNSRTHCFDTLVRGMPMAAWQHLMTEAPHKGRIFHLFILIAKGLGRF